MMKKADIPSFYQLRLDHCRCQRCGHTFVCRMAVDNVLVKFVDDSGQKERWLPTFERGGYLDLMALIVPGFDCNMPISMQLFRKFDKEFRKLQEPPSAGGHWMVAAGCTCPKCSGRSILVESEEIVDNPAVEWMTYCDNRERA